MPYGKQIQKPVYVSISTINIDIIYEEPKSKPKKDFKNMQTK